MLVVLQILLVFCVGGSVSQDSQDWTKNFMKMEAKIETLQEQLIKIFQENGALKSQLESVQKENEALKSQLESFTKENEARKIAFSAGVVESGSGHYGPFNDQILVFRKVFSNNGNAYDSNTGIFTAPVKGVYFFRYNLHSNSKITVAGRLYKNNEKQSGAYDYSSYNGNASNGAVLTLEAGDQVYIKLWDNSQVFDKDDCNYTSFSGFLLFPM